MTSIPKPLFNREVVYWLTDVCLQSSCYQYFCASVITCFGCISLATMKKFFFIFDIKPCIGKLECEFMCFWYQTLFLFSISMWHISHNSHVSTSCSLHTIVFDFDKIHTICFFFSLINYRCRFLVTLKAWSSPSFYCIYYQHWGG